MKKLLINVLKNTPLYHIFLISRIWFFSDDKIKIQLRKRGHLLDKANESGEEPGIYLFEVRMLLRAAKKRNISSNNTIPWVWEVLYKTYFKKDLFFKEMEQNSGSAMGKDKIIKLIKGRRSIRIWRKEMVNLKDIEFAIDLAQWAPSSCNRQLWKFLVLTKFEDINFVQSFTNQDFFKKASILIIPLVNTKEYQTNEMHYAYLDMGMIIQNLLLLLHDAGLGACCMGIRDSKETKAVLPDFRERFSVEQEYIPTCLIPVGHYDRTPHPPLRKKLSEILNCI